MKNKINIPQYNFQNIDMSRMTDNRDDGSWSTDGGWDVGQGFYFYFG